MSLTDAIDAIVAETAVVARIRDNLVVGRLIKAFKEAPFAQFDEDEILEELAAMSANVSFETKSFKLSGLSGLKDSRDARLKIDGARDRLIEMSRELHQAKVMTKKVIRAAKVYIRDSCDVEAKTAKHLDDVCDVALREIVDYSEVTDFLISEVKSALSLVDSKTKTLEAWFNLHKEYVFMTAATRGPRGEEETYRKASEGSGRGLGRKRRPRD